MLHEFLDLQAAQNPDQVAAVFLEQSLSYGELSRRANQLAHCLIEHGVARGDRVGIFMDKALDVPVALYGIFKAGAAYVPLDPGAPIERVEDIIADCDIHCLITSPRCAGRLSKRAETASNDLQLLGVETAPEGSLASVSWTEISTRYPFTDPAVKVTEIDLAYIIYTSGSTGSPKGIMHTHSSCLSFALWAAQEYALCPDDRVSNHAPLHFDLSIFDYFATLVAGAATVIIPEEYTRLPASYSQLLSELAVTVLFTVPFALIQLGLRGVLEQRDLSSLRLVIFGGEPMPPKYLDQMMTSLPHTSFDNMYGPAEVNGCSHYMLQSRPESGAVIPIGPITRIADGLLLDEEGVPVESVGTGQLLVRTPAMMAGYWNRADLNAAAFFKSDAGGFEKLWYRTGDLVHRQEDGVMVFLGRLDRQVKIRGYRVELDEIESALVAHQAVEEAAIFTVTDELGQAEVRGAVMPACGFAPEPEELLLYLRGCLPGYAVPATLRVMREFPRTSTGKIDRRALSKEEQI